MGDDIDCDHVFFRTKFDITYHLTYNGHFALYESQAGILNGWTNAKFLSFHSQTCDSIQILRVCVCICGDGSLQNVVAAMWSVFVLFLVYF